MRGQVHRTFSTADLSLYSFSNELCVLRIIIKHITLRIAQIYAII